MKVQDIVIEKIMKQLEEGVAPWQKPFFAIGKMNPVTGIVYSGINRWLLADSDQQMWLTFKQINEHGGKVKAGSQAHMIVFWKIYEKEKRNAAGEIETDKTFVLRYYNVFSLDQTEGIKPEQVQRWADKYTVGQDNKPVADIEDFISLTRAEIVHTDKTGAFYSPFMNKINMPDLEQFKSADMYYATLLHELTHWTGGKAQLDRITKDAHFSGAYGREELVAEIGASIMSAEYGIDHIKQGAAYIQSWIEAIRENKNIVFSAATKAEEAIKYLKDLVLKHMAE